MPRFAKRDNTETAARNFADKRSFVALDGTLRLYGKADWEPQRKLVLERDKMTCQECGYVAQFHLEIDHIIPRGQGGSDDLSNLRAMCFWCHKRKHGERNPKWSRR